MKPCEQGANDRGGQPEGDKYTAREIAEGGYALDLCGFP